MLSIHIAQQKQLHWKFVAFDWKANLRDLIRQILLSQFLLNSCRICSTKSIKIAVKQCQSKRRKYFNEQIQIPILK
jgi:hypothetical protein